MLTNIVVLSLGILISVVLTRSLGPEQRGVYVLLVTTNALMATVMNLGMGAACTTFLARGQYRMGEVNTVSLILALVLGAVSIGVVSLAFPFLHDTVFRQV